MPTQIIQGTSVSTLINIFKVAPERQMEAVELLIEATDKHIRQLPGFISANFHLSDNGTRIVNYAQWKRPTLGMRCWTTPSVSSTSRKSRSSPNRTITSARCTRLT